MSGRLPVIPNGLEVTWTPDRDWVVVHQDSGTRVVDYCATRAIALHFAEALGPVADWTRSREELAADDDVDRAVRLVWRDVAEATTRERRARTPRRRVAR